MEMEMEVEPMGANTTTTTPNRPPWRKKKLHLWILTVVGVLFVFWLAATETQSTSTSTSTTITPEDQIEKHHNQDLPTLPPWLQPQIDIATNPPYKPESPCLTARGDPCYARPYTYQKRGRASLSSSSSSSSGKEKKEALQEATSWGSWTLSPPPQSKDTTAYSNYPNRDVPWDQFPLDAWQRDTAYVSQFLDQGQQLVTRAMEAILTEYGHGNDNTTLLSFQERSSMFAITKLNDDDDDHDDDSLMDNIPPDTKQGGWTTTRSWKGLQRRLLHAIMTQDSFVLSMGGHSAAAGHGNHFAQSYTLQVQRILQPVLARLGVHQEARNFGQGGLGTVHNGMGASSLYGPDVDLLLWDSGMTEKKSPNIEVMARQAILGGAKIPFLFQFPNDITQTLHDHADMDVGHTSSAFSGIPKAEVVGDLNTIPYAARYLRCDQDIQKDFCKREEFAGVCWIDRSDYTPTTKQDPYPGGRASWHPGFRKHQLEGRILVFWILQALWDALEEWKESPDLILPEQVWHVTDYYENSRAKLRALDPSIGSCYQFNGTLPLGFCNHPIQARSEFTPRAYPHLTSLRSLMPPEMLENINRGQENVYGPPDVRIPILDPPPGDLDVLVIVERGSDYTPLLAPTALAFYPDAHPGIKTPSSQIRPGKGISLESREGFCDGTLDSFCSRGPDQTCLLRGHNDGRGGLVFDSYSGWLILNLPRVRQGIIVVKMECWHKANRAWKTQGWTSVNNQGDTDDRLLTVSNSTLEDAVSNSSSTKTEQATGSSASTNQHRSLNPDDEYCNSFQFQYAVNGDITTLDKDAFLERKHEIGKNVELLTILDDPAYTGGENKDIQIAIRMLGCGRRKVFKLTHVYWA